MTKSKNKKKKWIWFSVAIFLILFISGGAYAAHLYNKTSTVVRDSHEETGRLNEQSALREDDDNVDPVTDNVSILFLGVDTSDERAYGEESRTDALLVATFNKELGTVKLLSIPRDTYTFIPEVGYSTKINHAHAYGGPRATIETVEKFLHTPIDYYVRMNFEAFIDVVNSVNGVNYDVPFEIEEMDSADKKDGVHLYPGEQLLTGEETLGLVRTRKYDSDLERGKRQQEVLVTIADKITSTSSIFKLNEVIDSLGTNMRTNLTFKQMKSFLSYGLHEDINIEKITLGGDGGYMDDGIWYFHADEENLANVQRDLREHLDLPTYTSDDSDEDKTDNLQKDDSDTKEDTNSEDEDDSETTNDPDDTSGL